MSKATLTGTIKEGSVHKDEGGMGSFILLTEMGPDTLALKVQDHCSEAEGLEGCEVCIQADAIDGALVARHIAEVEPFDPDRTVQFKSTFSRRDGKALAMFEMGAGQVTPNSEKDFRRFVKQAQDHLGIPSLEEDKVIQDEE